MNGRIPAKNAIPEIVLKACEDFDATCGQVDTCVKQKPHKGNHAKTMLEERGVICPEVKTTSDCSDANNDFTNEFTQSDLVRAIPKNQDVEKGQLEMAINASMQYTNYFTPTYIYFQIENIVLVFVYGVMEVQ